MSSLPRGRAYTRRILALAKQPFIKFDVPSEPHLDVEGGILFRQKIATVTRYLEYGSGGSTVLASKRVPHLVSVESDKYFLASVARELAKIPAAGTRKLIYANIGFTKEWGNPVFTRPTARRLERWRNYCLAPWELYREEGTEPDLIFVDGRFRVACVLASLLKLRPGSTTPILIDDYGERYRVIEKVASLVSIHGRMGQLCKPTEFDYIKCTQLFEEYCCHYE